ncbi:MAG TPA: isoprenylcysteine carboxylmethyltransferase family protein [Vitreimonas sp.]|uniref:methanethiol S-methyltransferase n=1 Tax=Vitreimonas sp. TaxID=3069702 RepID=UPI002D4E580E|nr:methanethiol S-methyltransferase [Vitreimonas sp.]HYD86381.1 isoprenylcysteine carboxylmethyltransferase family protein [Vitreimonas sp.]
MARFATLAYGAVVYVFFLATFLYAIGFVGNLLVPKSIDSGAAAPLAEALIVNVLLLGLFAVQHSVMARPAFKRMWTKIVPKAAERSTFVLFASAILALMFWQWRPLPATIWSVADPLWSTVLWALFAAGWAIVLISTFLINHFDLFGLAQAYNHFRNRESSAPSFVTPLFYQHVRHPIYLGFILAFWATPVMSMGHLLFAIATTGYILVGIFFEERDLVALFGERYRQYTRDVGMLVPKLKLGGKTTKQA